MASDEILGAFAVSVPSHCLKGDTLERDMPELLLSIVNELELNITHS